MKRLSCYLGWHYVPQRQYGFYNPDAYNAAAWLWGSSVYTRNVGNAYCIDCKKERNHERARQNT